MDKRARENKRVKNICVYSGRQIGSRDAVLVVEAPNFLRNSGYVVVDCKDYLRNLGFIVSNKKFLGSFLIISLLLINCGVLT